MQDSAFHDELRRRLELLDAPENPDELPTRDVWIAAIVLAVVSAVLVWWGYPT